MLLSAWERSEEHKTAKRVGNSWAMRYKQDNDTPALNAEQALRGAPISMGRGEIPVELRPKEVPLAASSRPYFAYIFDDALFYRCVWIACDILDF